MKNKHKKETINLKVFLIFRTLKKHMMAKANLSNKIFLDSDLNSFINNTLFELTFTGLTKDESVTFINQFIQGVNNGKININTRKIKEPKMGQKRCVLSYFTVRYQLKCKKPRNLKSKI